jgi:hypothetical protein
MQSSNNDLAEGILSPEDAEFEVMFQRLGVSFRIPDPNDCRFHFAQDLSRHSPPQVDGHARSDSLLPIHDLYWDDLTRESS